MSQKVVGLIPSWDTYEKQLIDVSLSHGCLSLSLSLSKINLKKISNLSF